MTILFNKYQGTGNDFIIIDNRKAIINPEDSNLINKFCDRRFGIGETRNAKRETRKRNA